MPKEQVFVVELSFWGIREQSMDVLSQTGKASFWLSGNLYFEGEKR
jgi:hypothetical protein